MLKKDILEDEESLDKKTSSDVSFEKDEKVNSDSKGLDISNVKKTEKEEEKIEEKDVETDEKLDNEKENISEEEKTFDSISVQDGVIEKIKDFLAKIAEMQKEANEDIDEENSKENTKSEKVEKEKKPSYTFEYYDLPYRYNETIVKVLAQTPQKLFVYWDVSDNDRIKYENTFGKDFYKNTYPVLLVYNEDKKYVKEVPVNDFANSWYIPIDDSKTKYVIQLGRKFKYGYLDVDYNKVRENAIILKNDYLPYAESNMMEAPNDHVLLEDLPDYLVFRNVKTNQEFLINIKHMKSMIGNEYDVKGFYYKNYKDELDDGKFDMGNPSSRGGKNRGINSSTFK